MKKNYSILILLALMIWGIPSLSRAQWTVTDPSSLGFHIVQAVNSVIDKTQTFKEMLKTFGLDKIAYMIAQKASEKMTTAIVNSINGGASGDKAVNYITNFKQHFQDIGTQQLDTYAMELRSSSNPFAGAIERSLVDRSSGKTASGVNNFTLDKIPGVDWQAASNDLSAAGTSGLDFYAELARPQNTPVGASVLAQAELGDRVTTAKKISEIELVAPGTTPAKSVNGCVSGNGGSARGNELTYEQNLSALYAKLDAIAAEFQNTDDEARKEELNRQEDEVTQQVADLEKAGPGKEKFSANVDPGCLITSPGDVVGGLAKLALEEPIVRNRTADEFFKIVANSLTQITSAVINKGISSLKNRGSSNNSVAGSSGGLSVSQSANYYGSPRDTRNFESGNTPIQSIPTIIIDLNKELNETLPRTQAIIDATKKTLETIRIIPVVASDLDICTPGPDVNWKSRLDDYVAKKTKGLNRSSTKDNTKGENASDTLEEIETDIDLAKQETMLLSSDPLYNLPGAAESTALLESITQKTADYQQLIDHIVLYQNTLNGLRSVQSQVAASALAYQYPLTALNTLTAGEQQTIHGIDRLTLFTSDWDTLVVSQKEALYKASLVTFPNGTALPATTLERDIAMRDQVLQWQWDLWDSLMDTTPEYQKQKQLIYTSIDGMRPDLVSDSQLIEAESLQNQMVEYIKTIGDQFDDCLLIRTIFVNALYNTNLPYQTVTRSIDDQNNLIQTSKSLIVSDASALGGTASAAYKLAKQDYTLGDIPALRALKDAVAGAIPEKTDRLKKIFAKTSILDLTSAEVIDAQNKNKNLLDNQYQLGNYVIPTTIELLLRQDSFGVLFCTLQAKGFLYPTDTSIRRFHEIYCNPNINLSTVVGPDLIAGGGTNQVSTAKDRYRKIPFNWYFSNGLNDYIRFETPSI